MLSWACILCGYDFTRKLLAWYKRNAPPSFPWRETAQSLCHPRFGVHAAADAGERGFGILSPVSEAVFPRSLARAIAPQAVREAWDGPGYYARARNLHRLAREVTRLHDARYPKSPRITDTTRCRAVHSGSGGVLRV